MLLIILLIIFIILVILNPGVYMYEDHFIIFYTNLKNERKEIIIKR